MFTGIVADRGIITKISSSTDHNFQLIIAPQKLDLSTVKVGDSIATNGVCLTVIDKSQNNFTADVSHETYECTNLSTLVIGSSVHLEKALLVTDRLDGHIVTGHVDGLAELVAIEPHGKSTDFIISVPLELAKFIAKKGSLALDGISLTVNDLLDLNKVRLTIIPHTMQETNIQNWKVGQKINLEVDLMARYIDRLLNFNQEAHKNSSTNSELTYETLMQNNFI